MRYNIGDKVILKTEEEIMKEYGEKVDKLYCEKYAGKVFTICHILILRDKDDILENNIRYEFKEDEDFSGNSLERVMLSLPFDDIISKENGFSNFYIKGLALDDSRQTLYGFEKALDKLKKGKKICRKSWDNNEYLSLQNPNKNSKMTLPYIYCNSRNNEKRVPWIPSYADLLAEDWYEIN